MSIKKMPSKSFQNFTKKLNDLENYTNQEKSEIYDEWQKEHHSYLKHKYNFKKVKKQS